MIRLSQLKLRPGEEISALEGKIRKMLRLAPDQKFSFEVVRQSIDARKKPDIFYVCSVDVKISDENRVLKGAGKNPKIAKVSPVSFSAPPLVRDIPSDPPIVCGSGPAGLFCALDLARAGLHPVILERGRDVDSRQKDVENFWAGGLLMPESNVQFGEGGAGTFSDGKLNTGIKDPEGRIRFILRTFAEHGAPSDILYSYKPHVGTDILRKVVRSIREEIIRLGGTFLFETRLDEIERCGNNEVMITCRRTGAEDPGGSSAIQMKTRALVLAIGHSARDTFSMLSRSGFAMTPKAFAVGVRIQHPQEMIDEAMYGRGFPSCLPPSPYSLTHQEDGHGIYSFCMCPGGYVVNASSERGMLAVNGMSYRDRASKMANSAIVVTVSPEEYTVPGREGPLAGVAFARDLEKKAFDAGGGKIPLQRFEDFETGRMSGNTGIFDPCIAGQWVCGDITNVFPGYIRDLLIKGIHAFSRQIPLFDHPDSLLCAAESRTSSPLRILRDEHLQALNIPGVYPCGEGAGYAGGITSAASDGLKVSREVIRSYR